MENYASYDSKWIPSLNPKVQQLTDVMEDFFRSYVYDDALAESNHSFILYQERRKFSQLYEDKH